MPGILDVELATVGPREHGDVLTLGIPQLCGPVLVVGQEPFPVSGGVDVDGPRKVVDHERSFPGSTIPERQRPVVEAGCDHEALRLVGYARAQAAADAAALAAAPVTFSPFGATGSASREAAIFAAANGSVCVNGETWSLLKEDCEGELQGRLQIKGNGMQEIWTVTKAGEA